MFIFSGVASFTYADDTATAVSRVGDAMGNAVNKQGIFDWIGGSVGYNPLPLSAVGYADAIEDKSGAGEAILKITYSKAGFILLSVFVKTQATR